MLKVSALTNGRGAVSESDCLLLQHVLWEKPDERAQIYEWLVSNIETLALDLPQIQSLVRGLVQRAYKAAGAEAAGDARGEVLAELEPVRELLVEEVAALGGKLETVERDFRENIWLGEAERDAVVNAVGPKLERALEEAHTLAVDVLKLQQGLELELAPDLLAELLPDFGLPSAKPAAQPWLGPPEGVAPWPLVHTELTDMGENFASIAPEAARELCERGQGVIVDVRPPDEFAKFAIAGSVNVPLFRPVRGATAFDVAKRLAVGALLRKSATERNPDFALDAAAAIPPGAKQLIVACGPGGSLETVSTHVKAGPGGRRVVKTSVDKDKEYGRESRSLKGAYELLQAGFQGVAHLEGGVFRWRHEKLPMQ